MDAIEEENTDSSNDDSDDDDGDEDIEETEFVPSAWDAQATPTKSALRSPEKSNKVIRIISLQLYIHVYSLITYIHFSFISFICDFMYPI